MSVINTNIKSLISQNAMIKNNRDLGTAMQQLSTGKRINSAKDDAAGLAISSRMTAQIRGLDQAIRNGNDAVSMLQTTEGAMIEMSNMLQRMRELAVQSSNDTYTSNDRNFLDLEFQQLKTEINRITRDTQWNGMDILNGTFTNDAGQAGRFRFQVGGNQGQVITHNIPAMGFNESTGTASNAALAWAIDLSGDFSVGDKITVKLTDASGKVQEASYTVTGNDLISGKQSTTLESIATNLAAAVNSSLNIDLTPDAFNTTTNAITLGGTTVLAGVSVAQVNEGGQLRNLKERNIQTNTNSNTSMNAVDEAINNINSERGKIGALINRLTYATDNLTNVSQNTSESRSRILDTDYAKASAELARTQIISQAATAMLAQANQQPQTVLKLLQG